MVPQLLFLPFPSILLLDCSSENSAVVTAPFLSWCCSRLHTRRGPLVTPPWCAWDGQIDLLSLSQTHWAISAVSPRGDHVSYLRTQIKSHPLSQDLPIPGSSDFVGNSGTQQASNAPQLGWGLSFMCYFLPLEVSCRAGELVGTNERLHSERNTILYDLHSAQVEKQKWCFIVWEESSVLQYDNVVSVPWLLMTRSSQAPSTKI